VWYFLAYKNYTFLRAESEASQFFPSKMGVTIQIILIPGENKVKVIHIKVLAGKCLTKRIFYTEDN
jgi:hypothetical protein